MKRNIRKLCSHIIIYVLLSSFSIFVRFVKSSENPSIPPPTITRDQVYDNSEATLILAPGNGNYRNLTVFNPMSLGTSHKPPSSLTPLPNMRYLDHVGSVMPNNQLGLDIKEIILTNLDLEKPGPVMINSHVGYSRENDGYEFSSRYLIDDKSAIGNSYTFKTSY